MMSISYEMHSKTFAVCLLSILSFSFSAAGQSQTELNSNTLEGYQNVDNKLNAIYKQIIEEYSSDHQFISALKVSQKNWIAFRDSELKMKYPQESPGYYGSSFAMCESSYLQELTLDRIATLKKWLDGSEEGDVCSGSVRTNY